MSEEINFQKLSCLTCKTHKKRVQFIFTVEKCEKSLTCGDCLVLDKYHVNDHLDGFCSTDDYKGKIIFGIFQKFEESYVKLTNQEDLIKNNVQDIIEDFNQKVNKMQARIFTILNEHFSLLKLKIKSLVEMKFENYLKSLNDLPVEIKITRKNSDEFLDNLKKCLSQESMFIPDIEAQIRLFNNKKYYDGALIGRIDTLLNYLGEQANVTSNLEIIKSFF